MADTEKRCRLVEILQYECAPGEAGSPITCFPLPRIFRMCAALRLFLRPWILSVFLRMHDIRCSGQPAVELTAYVSAGRADGALMIPSGYMCVSLRVCNALHGHVLRLPQEPHAEGETVERHTERPGLIIRDFNGASIVITLQMSVSVHHN